MDSVLIVEDEEHLANGLRFNLEAEGYEVVVAADGEAALDVLLEKRRRFDAVVLDIMLPGKSGFAVASELRQAEVFIPILMLTARSRPEDVLRGFEAGADDYLPKPFELKILIARLRGLLRRREWMSREALPSTESIQEAVAPPPDFFRFAGKVIDFTALELRTADRIVHLTLMEADLLRYLIRHEGKPVARKAMLGEVWGLRDDTDTRAIDNFIVRLRRYIEIEPSKPQHLVTIRGIGYRFVAEP